MEYCVSDAEGYQAIAEVEEDAARKRQQRTLGQRLRWPLMIGGPAVVLAIVAFFVLTGGKFEVDRRRLRPGGRARRSAPACRGG